MNLSTPSPILFALFLHLHYVLKPPHCCDAVFTSEAEAACKRRVGLFLRGALYDIAWRLWELNCGLQIMEKILIVLSVFLARNLFLTWYFLLLAYAGCRPGNGGN